MIEILCMICPPIFAVKIFEKVEMRKYDLWEFIINYAIFTGIVNMLCLGIVAFLFHHPDYVVNSNMFQVSFACKYLLLSCFFSGIMPVAYEPCRRGLIKYNRALEGAVKVLDKNTKLFLSILVSFFFAFTIIVFVPYDMFFGNQSEFLFGFSDFWWIMASFGLLVFALLTVVLMVLPARIFAISLSLVFSLTFCAYLQRMFMNLYVTSMTGESLNIGEHPVWAVLNLLVWIGIVAVIAFLLVYDNEIWKMLIKVVSIGLVTVQGTALLITLASGNVALISEETFTDDKLYELSSKNNIIVFVLDTYDVHYTDVVGKQLFYDNLDGFTFFDNTTGVYSRTNYAVPYLLTGKEADNFQEPLFNFDVDKMCSESNFLPDLKSLGFDINIYTPYDDWFPESAKKRISNYSSRRLQMPYYGTLYSMLKCGLYFEVPYLLKPNFWFYNEFNEAVKESNAYTLDDIKLYQHLKESKLTIGREEKGFKFIHMFGAHNPYTINENVEKIPEGVQGWQQWVGCVKIVYEYINQMKELGIYDSSTIIITADHGPMEGNGELNFSTAPILFVKPAYAANERLKISHAPVSHTDIFPTIIQAAAGGYYEYGTPVFEISESAQRERIFHYMQLKDWNPDKIVDYKIMGDVKNFENWKAINP